MRPNIFYIYNESSRSDAKLCQELETRLYGLYRDRIAELAAAPPGPAWDGVYEATSK